MAAQDGLPGLGHLGQRWKNLTAEKNTQIGSGSFVLKISFPLRAANLVTLMSSEYLG